jgi:exosortase A-associated hydrolase 2
LRGCVVYIHPFAEEMNKSRRMAALQARALADAGFAVLQIDLLGCGDSSGDFGDATWQAWVDDVVRACAWLRQRDAEHGQVPLWLWGLRAGCLLAVAAASRLEVACNFCFWQAPASGKLLLQQFLRLRLAADMLGGNSKGLMDAMRQQLAQGSTVEVGGYLLGPALAHGLEAAHLAPPPAANGRQVWLELSTRADAVFSPVSAECQTQWRGAGYNTQAQLVQGPSFWLTTEIEDAPGLIAATTSAMLNTLTEPAATLSLQAAEVGAT